MEGLPNDAKGHITNESGKSYDSVPDMVQGSSSLEDNSISSAGVDSPGIVGAL